jgi:hypothetical protein
MANNVKKYTRRMGQNTGMSNMEEVVQSNAITVARVADNLG